MLQWDLSENAGFIQGGLLSGNDMGLQGQALRRGAATRDGEEEQLRSSVEIVAVVQVAKDSHVRLLLITLWAK